MKKPDRVEEMLDRLAVLRRNPDQPGSLEELKAALASKVSLAAAKAAKIVGEGHLAELIPDLLAAFDRLIANPYKLDKGCGAMTEIVGALCSLEYSGLEVYRQGIRHHQIEGPNDVSVTLRARSALGLAQTGHPDAPLDIVELLQDSEPGARAGAARALALAAGQPGILALRLKVLIGDPVPEVLGECFTGLLTADPQQSLPFVARYLDDPDPAVAEAAILALGESRQPRAFEILREKLERTTGGPLRRTLLLSIATQRLEPAIAYLLSLVGAAGAQTASEAIIALASIHRRDERIRSSVEGAVAKRAEASLTATFRTHF
ncbi:MAG: HEAT repeat domain-containing protein [Acidobacteriota bacterium]|nr:HEAT repeat domain-containing protein [Acidobacteriota bacterium]